MIGKCVGLVGGCGWGGVGGVLGVTPWHNFASYCDLTLIKMKM